jgi:hypothetical protein
MSSWEAQAPIAAIIDPLVALKSILPDSSRTFLKMLRPKRPRKKANSGPPLLLRQSLIQGPTSQRWIARPVSKLR